MAENPSYFQTCIGNPIGGFCLGRWHSEPSVEAWQELTQNTIGLLQGAGIGQPQLRHQPVLEGAVGPLHSPFRLWAVGEYLSYAELSQGTAPLSRSNAKGSRVLPKPLARRLEDRVAVRIYAQRDAMPGNDAL